MCSTSGISPTITIKGRILVPVTQEIFRASLRSARGLIEREGIALVPGSNLMALDGIGEGFPEFAQIWSNLPEDPYFIGAKPNRFRRHAQLDLDADTDAIASRPNTGYFQAPAFNPLFGGIVRHFAPIEWVGNTGNTVRSLVRLASHEVFGLSGRWLINIHFVRIVSAPDSTAPPAPEGQHRDGYDFISLHLVDRDNDVGGENLILDQAGGELYAITLNAPLDTLYMDDRRFRHDVTPISAAGRHCHRDMILMSYERPDNERRPNPR
jgi:hypothetical protein